MTTQQHIAARLRQARIDRGLSMYRVAKLAHISAATVTKVESCQVTPSVLMFLRFCRAMEVEPGVILADLPDEE